MKDMEVVESIHNAWTALVRQYQKRPDEGIRCGMNLLAKIIGRVRSEVEESHREKQVSVDEWILMLENGSQEDCGGKGIWRD